MAKIDNFSYICHERNGYFVHSGSDIAAAEAGHLRQAEEQRARKEAQRIHEAEQRAQEEEAARIRAQEVYHAYVFIIMSTSIFILFYLFAYISEFNIKACCLYWRNL